MPDRISNVIAFILALFVLPGSWWNLLSAAEVTATRLDGSAVTGELHTWNNGQVVVTSSAGDESIATERLFTLRWPARPEAEKRPTTAPGLAELTDGTLLPIESLLVTGGQATLKLPAAFGADATIKLSVKKLAVVRFVPLDDVLAKQWDDIRQTKPSGDLLVVRKRDGKSLDYVDGVLGEISADKVELKVDGEANRADRAKVAGVYYLRSPLASMTEPRVLLQGRSGLRAGATNVEVVGQNVTITTSSGFTFTWPTGDLELADFSRGKIAYLSDLQAVSHDWTPLVGLPAGVTTAAEYGQFRRDQSAFGSAPSVFAPAAPGDASQTPSLRTFDKGLAIRSRTELVYRLPAGFSRFTALAGIEPATANTGVTSLAIFADDRLVFQAEVNGTRSPVPIDLPIGGTKRLKIVVDFGKNQDTGDWLNLCDAKIVK